jgi:hypothetical protein
MKRMAAYPTACLAMALLLAGCGSDRDWARQGSSSSKTAFDLSDCQSQARDATQRDTHIMNDILATRGNDWRNTDVMSTQMAMFSAENHNRTGDLVTRCMIGKGYAPGT